MQDREPRNPDTFAAIAKSPVLAPQSIITDVFAKSAHSIPYCKINDTPRSLKPDKNDIKALLLDT